MYLRYVIDPIPKVLSDRKAHEIVSRHIEARNKVVHLRRKLQVFISIGLKNTRVLGNIIKYTSGLEYFYDNSPNITVVLNRI